MSLCYLMMYLTGFCNKVALKKNNVADLYSGTSHSTQSVAIGAAEFAFDNQLES